MRGLGVAGRVRFSDAARWVVRARWADRVAAVRAAVRRTKADLGAKVNRENLDQQTWYASRW